MSSLLFGVGVVVGLYLVATGRFQYFVEYLVKKFRGKGE